MDVFVLSVACRMHDTGVVLSKLSSNFLVYSSAI